MGVGLDIRYSGGDGVRYLGRGGGVHRVRHGNCVKDGCMSWEEWSSRE